MFLIVRVSGLITKLHPPRGALSVRAVSAAPASATGAGVVSRTALEGGEGEGMAEHRGGRWRLVCSQVRGDRSLGLFDRNKSDTLISMVALANVDFRAGPG